MNKLRNLFRKREPEEPEIWDRAIRVACNWDASGGKVILIHGNTNTELSVPVTNLEVKMQAGYPVKVTMGILCGGLDLIQELTEENPLLIEVNHKTTTSKDPPPWACKCKEKDNAKER